MPGSFFNTSVLLFLASDDATKADRAEALIGRGGTISVQVLNEVTNVARRKMRMPWRETLAFLSMFGAQKVCSFLKKRTKKLLLTLAEPVRRSQSRNS